MSKVLGLETAAATIRNMPHDANDDYPDVRRDERERIIAALATVASDAARDDIKHLLACVSSNADKFPFPDGMLTLCGRIYKTLAHPPHPAPVDPVGGDALRKALEKADAALTAMSDQWTSGWYDAAGMYAHDVARKAESEAKAARAEIANALTALKGAAA